MVTVLLLNSLPAVSAFEPIPSQPTEQVVRTSVRMPLDVATWQSAIDATGQFTLPIPLNPLDLRVHEHDIFLPGHKFVSEPDSEGGFRYVEDITARSFFGGVAGIKRSSVVITMDVPKQAVYGTLYFDNMRVDIITDRPESGAESVALFSRHTGDLPLPPPDHGSLTVGADGGSAAYEAVVKVDADSPYRNYAPD